MEGEKIFKKEMSDSKDFLGSGIHSERASLSYCKFCSSNRNDLSSRLSNMGCQTLRHLLENPEYY